MVVLFIRFSEWAQRGVSNLLDLDRKYHNRNAEFEKSLLDGEDGVVVQKLTHEEGF